MQLTNAIWDSKLLLVDVFVRFQKSVNKEVNIKHDSQQQVVGKSSYNSSQVPRVPHHLSGPQACPNTGGTRKSLITPASVEGSGKDLEIPAANKA